jgi:hypothetical protein
LHGQIFGRRSRLLVVVDIALFRAIISSRKVIIPDHLKGFAGAMENQPGFWRVSPGSRRQPPTGCQFFEISVGIGANPKYRRRTGHKRPVISQYIAKYRLRGRKFFRRERGVFNNGFLRNEPKLWMSRYLCKSLPSKLLKSGRGTEWRTWTMISKLERSPHLSPLLRVFGDKRPASLWKIALNPTRAFAY